MDRLRTLYSTVVPGAVLSDTPTDEEQTALLGGDAPEPPPHSLLQRASGSFAAVIPMSSSVSAAASAASKVASKAVSKAAVAAGVEEAPPKTWRDELREALTLSFKTRFIGFLVM